VNGMRGIMIIAACLLAAGSAAAEEPSAPPAPGSTELVENAGTWDGRTVGFTGESIGEAMRRGTMAWIHLNDDAYGLADSGAVAALAGANSGIAVWVDADDAALVSTFGDFRHHGDLVEVTGTFNANCPVHGGDMDIHASSLSIVRSGYTTIHQVQPSRVIAAVILAGLTLVLFLLNLRTDRHSIGSLPQPEPGRNRQPRRGTLGG
jgi:hypothetical protein